MLSWEEPTLTFHASSIDTSSCDEYIMYYGENAFTAYPAPISVLDLAIVEHRSLIQLNASAMYGSRKWDLIGMKIFPA